MRRFMILLVLIALTGAGACRLLLPERFAVRGPFLNSLLGRSVDSPDANVVERRFTVADGYTVEVFADGIQNARMMRFSPGGDLLVSQPKLGRVLHVLRDRDGDGRSDGHRPLIEQLDRPHGLDFHDGALFIGETGAIVRVPVAENGPDTLRLTGPPDRIVEGLPAGGNHWSRTLRFGPDGGLYLHVGSSCNVCEEEDERRATLLRFEPDGSGEEIFAAGLRNSVGFDWQPGTGALYATDNGRDLLGDNEPPCELNRLERGAFYGWPYANGDRVPDPDFGAGQEALIAASRPPAHAFRAHNAPLGITFLRHPSHAPALRGAALVALHGSWNRTRLDGYKVISLHWSPSGAIEERDFLVGFEVEEEVIGRPVDVIEDRDGSILVSDDYSGTIYRIRRGAPGASAAAPLAVTGPRIAARTADQALAALSPQDRERLDAEGAALFERHACSGCHLQGEAAAGVVVRPLQTLAGRYTIEDLERFLVTPTPPMPVFDLSEADRRALAVHLLGRFR
jgi:glucose/arabinose dehydrogenase